MELLAERITESTNDLGRQIDNLYKLSQKDRQSFLNKIQTFKTTLLGLKSNLKMSNKEFIQNQYKTVRCEIIEMKRFMDVKLQEVKFKNANLQNRNIQQNRLNSCKIGKRNGSISKVNESLFDASGLGPKSQLDGSRVGVMRHITKKEYEQLMKNIVEKTQLNQQLTGENSILKQQNTELKEANTQLISKIELYEHEKLILEQKLDDFREKFQKIQTKLKEKQREFQQLKENDMETRTRNSRSALQISQLRNQLDIANQKLLNFSNFEQIHSYKQSLLQQDISKCQNQIAVLHQQHYMKQISLSKRIKELQECEQNYNQSLKKINRLQIQLDNQKQDIQVLESELTKSQKQFYELKIQKENSQTNLDLTKQQYFRKDQEKNKEIETIKEMLIDSQQQSSMKQMEINNLKAQITEWEQNYIRQRSQRQSLEDLLNRKETGFDKQRQAYVCGIQLKKIEISKLSDQVKKSLQLTRTLQQQINQNHANRTRIREDYKVLSNDLKDYQIKNLQINKNYQQLKQLYLEAIERLNLQQSQIQSSNKTIKSLENQVKQAKIRLHKAKIQAIHDIRNSLF